MGGQPSKKNCFNAYGCVSSIENTTDGKIYNINGKNGDVHKIHIRNDGSVKHLGITGKNNETRPFTANDHLNNSVNQNNKPNNNNKPNTKPNNKPNNTKSNGNGNKPYNTRSNVNPTNRKPNGNKKPNKPNNKPNTKPNNTNKPKNNKSKNTPSIFNTIGSLASPVGKSVQNHPIVQQAKNAKTILNKYASTNKAKNAKKIGIGLKM